MRIVVVCPGWPGKINKFNGVFVRDQVRQLKQTGADVSVVTARVFKEDPMSADEGGIHVYRFRFPSERKLLAEYDRVPYFRVIIYLVTGIIKTVRIVRREKADLIHAHFVIPTGFIAVVAGGLTRRPVVITAHDSDVSTYPDQSRLARALIIWTIRKSSRLVPTTSQLADRVKRDLAVPREKIEVIPLGIDTETFKPREKGQARKRLGLPEGRPIALFVGAFMLIKGVDIVVKVMPAVLLKKPDVTFIFVGAGPMEEELKAEIAAQGNESSAIWPGPKPHDELPDWYAAADVLLFPIPKNCEGQGMVVVEAAAMGLPVIATEAAGIPDSISDGANGYLINPEDQTMLVDRIGKALESGAFPEEEKESKRIRAAVNPQSIAKQILSLYGSISDNKS
jgi:glycosyltransferase involved in cell wall biosynthesis